MRLTAIAVLLFSCATLCAAQSPGPQRQVPVAGVESGANWTYEGKTGPLAWGRLDPAYQACSRGQDRKSVV